MRKEEFFEVLGEIDDNIMKGVKTPMKKKINWKVWSGVAACLAVVTIFGISMMQSNTSTNERPNTGMKPVINFEGVVAAVDDNRVVLNDGKIILITENTEFIGDPDIGKTVSEDILVGNFIQGYTEDAIDEAEITASKIWTNEGRTVGNGKRVINFEGRVVKVEQDRITLDNGKIVRIAEDTTITSPDGTSAEIVEGDYIQGYAENVENTEITAKYILVTTL